MRSPQYARRGRPAAANDEESYDFRAELNLSPRKRSSNLNGFTKKNRNRKANNEEDQADSVPDSHAVAAADALGRDLEAMGYNLNCESFITRNSSEDSTVEDRYARTANKAKTEESVLGDYRRKLHAHQFEESEQEESSSEEESSVPESEDDDDDDSSSDDETSYSEEDTTSTWHTKGEEPPLIGKVISPNRVAKPVQSPKGKKSRKQLTSPKWMSRKTQPPQRAALTPLSPRNQSKPTKKAPRSIVSKKAPSATSPVKVSAPKPKRKTEAIFFEGMSIVAKNGVSSFAPSKQEGEWLEQDVEEETQEEIVEYEHVQVAVSESRHEEEEEGEATKVPIVVPTVAVTAATPKTTTQKKGRFRLPFLKSKQTNMTSQKSRDREESLASMSSTTSIDQRDAPPEKAASSIRSFKSREVTASPLETVVHQELMSVDTASLFAILGTAPTKDSVDKVAAVSPGASGKEDDEAVILAPPLENLKGQLVITPLEREEVKEEQPSTPAWHKESSSTSRIDQESVAKEGKGRRSKHVVRVPLTGEARRPKLSPMFSLFKNKKKKSATSTPAARQMAAIQEGDEGFDVQMVTTMGTTGTISLTGTGTVVSMNTENQVTVTDEVEVERNTTPVITRKGVPIPVASLASVVEETRGEEDASQGNSVSESRMSASNASQNSQVDEVDKSQVNMNPPLQLARTFSDFVEAIFSKDDRMNTAPTPTPGLIAVPPAKLKIGEQGSSLPGPHRSLSKGLPPKQANAETPVLSTVEASAHVAPAPDKRNLRVTGVTKTKDSYSVASSKTKKRLKMILPRAKKSEKEQKKQESAASIASNASPASKGSKNFTAWSRRRPQLEKESQVKPQVTNYPVEYGDDNCAASQTGRPSQANLPQDIQSPKWRTRGQAGKQQKELLAPIPIENGRSPTNISSLGAVAASTSASAVGNLPESSDASTTDGATSGGDAWNEIVDASRVVGKAFDRVENDSDEQAIENVMSILSDESTIGDVEKALDVLKKHAKRLGVRESDLLQTLRSNDDDSLLQQLKSMDDDTSLVQDDTFLLQEDETFMSLRSNDDGDSVRTFTLAEELFSAFQLFTGRARTNTS